MGKDKEKTERSRSESSGTLKMEPAEVIAFLKGESPTTKQFARLSSESVQNYAEQSIFESAPHEVAYSLAEDLSYKLRHIIHEAHIKANLSGRTALLGSDIEACLESLAVEKVYGASNSSHFSPLSDKHLYLQDSVVNLVMLVENTATIIQPGDAILTKQSWLPTGPAMNNYVRYFTAMCHTLISNTPQQRQEALRDVRCNAHIGPIVNWFYHFGYFLLSKDITYVSLTMSALQLIEALESNPIARQQVGEKELKLLPRLILQRLLRTRTDYEVIKPMCSVLAMLCIRAPLRELVIGKIEQRRQEFNTDYALPLVCIINALGIDVLRPYVDQVMHLYRNAKAACAPNLHLLTAVIMYSHRLLQTHDATAIEHNWAFYEAFNFKLIPHWRSMCTCPASASTKEYETNFRVIFAQHLKSIKRILPIALRHRRRRRYKPQEVFDPCLPPCQKQLHIRLKYNAAVETAIDDKDEHTSPPQQSSKNDQKQEFVTIGRWSPIRGRANMKNLNCLHYNYLIL